MAIVTVPFSGFYNSLHDSEIDRALESMFADRDTGTERNEGLESALHIACNFRQVFVNYAAKYVKQFAAEFGVDGLKFESLASPKEYNFSTDVIYATVTKKELTRIYKAVKWADLAALVKSKFTSCDGFHSFYSPDLAEWGPINEWDHNQYGTLLECFANANAEFDQYAEYSLCEDFSGNGDIERWIGDATPNIQRLYKIQEYLETRKAR